MSKFIRIKNIIININYIQSISVNVNPNTYYIRMASNSFEGSSWKFGIVGLGTISSHNSEITICETNDQEDYKKVTKWINTKIVE